MAKEVIVLETNTGDGGFLILRTAFWLAVAPGQEVPLSALGPTPTVWKGASPEEIAAIQAGQIVEEVRTFIFGQSLGIDDIHKLIQIAYADRVEYLAALPPKGQYYGSYFDGAQWITTKG